LEICLEESAKMELSLPCLALVKQFYTALKAQGHGRLGTQALIKVYENLNNHKIHK
jgi:3-hydroxyisobutyrate dehydrogenase